MDVFGMLRADRGRYEEDGLWNPLLSAMRSLLQHRTSTFSLTHYDAAQCRAKGWGLTYADISNGEGVRALLTDWFAPELRDQPDSWESFWTQWADDVDSHRTCHLLDAVKHQLTGENEMGILPNSFMQRLADAGFVESLLVRARPLAGPRSPTWEEDVRHACARRQ
ncbi:MAG: hypothetical protein JST93_07165 [Acidobacteria bacterium]|nr:hypothetical protein [Acidobacteriota bacterium]